MPNLIAALCIFSWLIVCFCSATRTMSEIIDLTDRRRCRAEDEDAEGAPEPKRPNLGTSDTEKSSSEEAGPVSFPFFVVCTSTIWDF